MRRVLGVVFRDRSASERLARETRRLSGTDPPPSDPIITAQNATGEPSLQLSGTDPPPIDPIITAQNATGEPSLQGSSVCAYPPAGPIATVGDRNQYQQWCVGEGSSAHQEIMEDEDTSGENKGPTVQTFPSVYTPAYSVSSPASASSSLSSHSGNSPRVPNQGLFGVLWTRLQQLRFFRRKYSRGPRSFKLCAFPHPKKPGQLAVHNLCIQNTRDREFVAKHKSTEKYSETVFNPEELALLNEYWINCDEKNKQSNEEFREAMWGKHGVHSGLSVHDYFIITMTLFAKVNQAYVECQFSGVTVTAKKLAVDFHQKLEPKCDKPLISAFPEIVCNKGDTEKVRALKEIRQLFEGQYPYVPRNCRKKRNYVNCEDDTFIKL